VTLKPFSGRDDPRRWLRGKAESKAKEELFIQLSDIDARLLHSQCCAGGLEIPSRIGPSSCILRTYGVGGRLKPALGERREAVPSRDAALIAGHLTRDRATIHSPGWAQMRIPGYSLPPWQSVVMSGTASQ
jgi:hypothetical protein